MGRIFAISEQYPSLRSSEAYQGYMKALVDAEKNIARRRITYNIELNMYTTATDSFPGLLFFKLYEFETYEFFNPKNEPKSLPRVSNPHEKP